ncbi:MAG: alpha/beta hydrolase [Magnetococcus sp. DMHC-8]
MLSFHLFGTHSMRKPFTGHWQQTGTGIPVLGLSGFASGHWMLHDLLAPLGNQGCFILPDNRGMGLSPPASAPYSLADLADDGLQLVDELGHDRFAVIGLSMGGFVAQRLALAAPRRVRRLVLLCTASAGELFRPHFPLLTRQQVAEIYRLPPEERIRAALSPAFCPLLAERYPRVYEAVFRQRLAHPEQVDQVLYQYDAVAQFLASDIPLSAITCPTLVLAGDQDRLVPRINAELLAQQLPNAQLAIVPDTDHLFFLEKREEVSQMIARFLV